MKAPHTLRLALGEIRTALSNLQLGIDHVENGADSEPDDGKGTIYDRVIAAMQEAEEIGGPTDGDYVRLMEQIAQECTHRAKVCSDRMAEEWAVVKRIKEAHKAFPVGSRVVTIKAIDRYPDFMLASGKTGTVTESDEKILVVTMDEHVPGAEEWENGVVWYEHDLTYAAEDLALAPPAIPYAIALPESERVL